MTESKHEDFRELLNARFDHLEKQMNLRFAAEERARELAASELSRRLDILNHAHAEALRVQQTYLPREIWEARHRAHEEKLASLDTWKANMQGRMAAFWIAFTIITILVNVAMRYIKP